MKTPAFWQQRGITSSALLPASMVYGAVSRWRMGRVTPLTLPIPVICIGNATVGGAGKTPVALAIGERLRARGINAFFLSRGYGGSAQAPLQVMPDMHHAHEVGDEPLLLAKCLPTIVARQRIAGAQLAMRLGAEAIIMDDGLQNPLLHKTLSLLVVDGGSGLGNGRLLPAGPLRERWHDALARVQAIVIVQPQRVALDLPPELPCLYARVEPLPAAQALAGCKVLAFCGLALPDKFFATVRGLGAELVETVAFADHHPYTSEELASLAARAQAHGACLATTEKDGVRLPDGYKGQVTIIPIRLVFAEPNLIDALLDTVFA